MTRDPVTGVAPVDVEPAASRGGGDPVSPAERPQASLLGSPLPTTDPASSAGGGVVAPPAPRSLRLAASGPELALALAAEIAGAVILPLGVAVSLGLAAFFAARDLDGGRLSPGKRLCRVRVVDAATGRAPTPRQAVVRNTPWVLGFLLSAVPGFEVLGWLLLSLAAVAEGLLAAFGPDGRRLGDWLAETRVVSGPPESGP